MDDEAVCTCGKRLGFMRDPTSPVEWWVCNNCEKPTRLYLDRKFTDATPVAGDD